MREIKTILNVWIYKLTNQWMNDGMNEWMNKWCNERMNEWWNERMNKWWNERMNECMKKGNDWMIKDVKIQRTVKQTNEWKMYYCNVKVAKIQINQRNPISQYNCAKSLYKRALYSRQVAYGCHAPLNFNYYHAVL